MPTKTKEELKSNPYFQRLVIWIVRYTRIVGDPLSWFDDELQINPSKWLNHKRPAPCWLTLPVSEKTKSFLCGQKELDLEEQSIPLEESDLDEYASFLRDWSKHD